MSNYKGYQYTETINGTEYTFKYPGHRRSLEIMDDARPDGNISLKDFNTALLSEVVVYPKVDLDYFDQEEHMDDYKEVLRIAAQVLNGRFPKRENADKKGNASEGKA